MRLPWQARSKCPQIGLVVGTTEDSICVPGYTSLDKCPEVMTACRRIAELIGSITIHLMKNTDNGDVRIVNELSKMIDITPMPNMTRSTWVQAFVTTMLLQGRGNAIVLPHTRAGIIKRLEPIAASRVSWEPIGWSDYNVFIDGRKYRPDDVLHFVYNPDPVYLWKGQGVNVSLKDVANNLNRRKRQSADF